VVATVTVVAGGAAFARPAGLEDLDGDAVACRHTPPFFRTAADLLDHAHALVSRDEREPTEEVARELLVVGSTKPAGFDPEESVVVADGGPRELAAAE
jgi:hypothetical protein